MQNRACSFSIAAPTLWNGIPESVRTTPCSFSEGFTEQNSLEGVPTPLLYEYLDTFVGWFYGQTLIASISFFVCHCFYQHCNCP